MITKLSDKDLARLSVVRDECLAVGLSTAPADRALAESACDEAYKVAGLEPPAIKIWLRSPLEGVLAAHLLSQVDDQVWAQVRDQVWDQVGIQVKGQVWRQVWDQVGYQVWDQVRDQVWVQVWAQVRDQVRGQVRDQVGAQIGRCGYGLHDAGWLSFYAFFHALLPETVLRLVPLMNLARSCGWWWPFNRAVILTERPSQLHRDDQHRLHNATGPAILYPDGWGIWAWHGTRIPREWIEDKGSLTPQTALTHPNVEQRRCAAEILGWDNILSQLQPQTIDKDHDPMVGELLQVDLPDAPAQQFLRVLCGTGRTFVLPCVHNRFKTALEANAASWGEHGVDPQLVRNRSVRT